MGFFRKNTQDVESNTPASRRAARFRSTDTAPDPELSEKKRARRRLVGAVALVLAAVIVLPIIFDAEQKNLPEDITIQIPSMESASTHARLPTPTSIATTASLDKKEELVAPVPALTPITATPPVGDNEKNKALVPTTNKVETQDAPPPVADADKKADKPKEDKPHDDKAKDSKVAKDFIIQVAALASPVKIKELQTKLSNAGIASYTQKVDTESGEKIRLRVGHFKNKEDLDKMQAKLKKIGISGTVITTNPSK